MIFDLPLPSFTLSCGLGLPGLHLRGWAAGPGIEPLAAHAVEDPAGQPVRRGAQALAAVRRGTAPRLDPAVPTLLLVHALTGDAVAEDWWSWVVGPGKVFDTTRYRVLCFNHLGSCYGSYGAADADFPRWHELAGVEVQGIKGALDAGPAWRPAPLTTWDLARAQLLALDALGIEGLAGVAGGSIGGDVALALQALVPHRIETVIAAACGTRSTPWILGWNHLGRTAVLRDPAGGLELARSVAHLSYRAEIGLEARQGRDRVGAGPRAPYAVQTYLAYQGRKLAGRFEPAAYVAMLDAMDNHDLEERVEPDPVESWSAEGPWGLDRLHDVRAIGISTDQLFLPHHLQTLAGTTPRSRFELLESPHGHDAFLIETPELIAMLARAMGDSSGSG